MTTEKTKAPRKTPVKLSQRDEIALLVLPAIYASAGYEILNQKDGVIADRAIHISRELADRFLASA